MQTYRSIFRVHARSTHVVWLLHSGLPRPNDPCFFQRIVSSYRMVKENRIISREIQEKDHSLLAWDPGDLGCTHSEEHFFLIYFFRYMKT